MTIVDLLLTTHLSELLRFYTYTAGGLSSILGQGTKAKKSGGRVGGEGIKKKMTMVTEKAEVEAVSSHHFGW